MSRALLLALALLPVFASASVAEPPAPSEVPVVEGLALDGRPDEAGWSRALALACDTVDVPAPPPAEQPVALGPTVRLAQQDGRLWIAVTADEDPGMSVGLRLFVGPDDIPSAADALAVAFAPQDLRVPRWSVRGAKGISRSQHYRLDGAVHVAERGRWSLEVALPLADLELAAPGAVLRLALAAATRTPNLVAAAPRGALWESPSRWVRLAPEGGAWTTGPAPEIERIAAEDALDQERQRAWAEFEVNSLKTLPDGTAEGLAKAVEGRLLEPLGHVARLRPDLAPWVACVRADLLRRLGRERDAEAALTDALAAIPGSREAAFLLHVKLRGAGLAEAAPSEPSDYGAALARLTTAAAAAGDPWVKEGLALARGLLLYKRGELADAVAALEPLARRYAAEPLIVLHLEQARAALETWGEETMARQKEAKADTLPRVTLTTTKGAVMLELFEDDLPNTVKNFVWLVERGFYDGLAFHRNVPFFAIQSGDPFSKEGADARWLGGGGPGYAVPTEPVKRRPTRGAVALATTGQDTGGSQFLLLLGTAAHLDDASPVFGRILEGQDVAESLVQGDRIVKAEVTRRRAGTVYRPLTLAGEPAPEPTATPPTVGR
jgi:peptidyl-prolyl cis-trans isomerase B (cyclophilin B)